MKKLLTLLLLFAALHSFGQTPSADVAAAPINKLYTKEYSKEMTEYLAKIFIAKDVLKLQENDLTGFQINAVTASQSDELTTVLYNCPKLNQKGIVLVFWTNKTYSFYNFEYSEAVILMDRISAAIENNKTILDEVNTSVLKSNDIHFLFEGSYIRVLWNENDSGWDNSNFKTTYHKFDKFFKKDF